MLDCFSDEQKALIDQLVKTGFGSIEFLNVSRWCRVKEEEAEQFVQHPPKSVFLDKDSGYYPRMADFLQVYDMDRVLDKMNHGDEYCKTQIERIIKEYGISYDLIENMTGIVDGLLKRYLANKCSTDETPNIFLRLVIFMTNFKAIAYLIKHFAFVRFLDFNFPTDEAAGDEERQATLEKWNEKKNEWIWTEKSVEAIKEWQRLTKIDIGWIDEYRKAKAAEDAKIKPSVVLPDDGGHIPTVAEFLTLAEPEKFFQKMDEGPEKCKREILTIMEKHRIPQGMLDVMTGIAENKLHEFLFNSTFPTSTTGSIQTRLTLWILNFYRNPKLIQQLAFVLYMEKMYHKSRLPKVDECKEVLRCWNQHRKEWLWRPKTVQAMLNWYREKKATIGAVVLEDDPIMENMEEPAVPNDYEKHIHGF